MNIKDLYDAVIMSNPCSHNTFLTHVDTTCRTLIAKYGMNYVCVRGDEYVRARSVDDTVPVYDDYTPAVMDNVLYLLTGDESHKVDFINNSDYAYKTVWRRKSKGKTMKDRRFVDYV